MINYELSVLIAVSAFTYSFILTEPKMLLNGFYKWLANDVFKYETDQEKFGWLFKIIIHCERCVSGQAAFWIYPLKCTKYDFIQHAFFVLITIFITHLIKKTHERLFE